MLRLMTVKKMLFWCSFDVPGPKLKYVTRFIALILSTCQGGPVIVPF